MSGEGGTMASGAATLGTHRGSIRGDTVDLVTVRPEDGTAPPTAWEMAPLRVGDAIRGTVAVREPIGTATRVEDGHFEARNDDRCVQRKREKPNHRDTVRTTQKRALDGHSDCARKVRARTEKKPRTPQTSCVTCHGLWRSMRSHFKVKRP